ncbi:hypothetical protein ACJMK2_013774 [Sinanodonta woodiana]|uniref:EGF-like domain-containing protein n=1 Tax=Sinanodonta woodiana TaxID=1069815 RepID=A0ABD3UYK7_SINWO
MSGENRKVLVSTRLGHPAGLTIDYWMNDRVFWCDSKENLLESMSWDGSDRVLVTSSGIYNPVGIDVFESLIYWVSMETGQLLTIDKFGRGINTTLQSGLLLPKTAKVAHQLRVDLTVKNRCPRTGNQCSHLCLLIPGGFRCACPEKTTFRDNDMFICDAASETSKPLPKGCGCWNGGTCIRSNDSEILCHCPPGYSGEFCEEIETSPITIREAHSLPIVAIVIPITTVFIFLLILLVILLKKGRRFMHKAGDKQQKVEGIVTYKEGGNVQISTPAMSCEAPEPFSVENAGINFSNPVYETLRGGDPSLTIASETELQTQSGVNGDCAVSYMTLENKQTMENHLFKTINVTDSNSHKESSSQRLPKEVASSKYLKKDSLVKKMFAYPREDTEKDTDGLVATSGV